MFDGHGYYIRGARFAPHAVVDDLIRVTQQTSSGGTRCAGETWWFTRPT